MTKKIQADDRDWTSKLKGEKKERYEQLIDLQEELLNQIEDFSVDYLIHEKETGLDSADLGSESYNKDIGLQLISNEEKELILINDAIQRLKDKTYGKCIDCKKTIEKGRLDALPYAKLCIVHKEEREKREKFGNLDNKILTE
ncbi:MAG: TraR/DksA family transcriptional regulator [Verrucomicrobiota bacterium]|nr:TraR/DksA family transcriptional regulator [Verrucomicrobiota bacterium]